MRHLWAYHTRRAKEQMRCLDTHKLSLGAPPVTASSTLLAAKDIELAGGAANAIAYAQFYVFLLGV